MTKSHAKVGTKMRDPLKKVMKTIRELMPEKVYLMRNPKRYQMAKKSAEDISNAILAIDKDAKISLHQDELLGTMLCLEIETCELSITDINKVCRLLRDVDTIDIGCLINGNVTLTFGFNDAWIPAPPADK